MPGQKYRSEARVTGAPLDMPDMLSSKVPGFPMTELTMISMVLQMKSGITIRFFLLIILMKILFLEILFRIQQNFRHFMVTHGDLIGMQMKTLIGDHILIEIKMANGMKAIPLMMM